MFASFFNLDQTSSIVQLTTVSVGKKLVGFVGMLSLQRNNFDFFFIGTKYTSAGRVEDIFWLRCSCSFVLRVKIVLLCARPSACKNYFDQKININWLWMASKLFGTYNKELISTKLWQSGATPHKSPESEAPRTKSKQWITPTYDGEQ